LAGWTPAPPVVARSLAVQTQALEMKSNGLIPYSRMHWTLLFGLAR